MSKKSNTVVQLDDIEHVIKRADMYMGSKTFTKIEEYPILRDFETGIEYPNIYVAPGFIHIFLELLSNSVDAVINSVTNNFPLPSSGAFIEITYNKDKGMFTLKNYGQPISVDYSKGKSKDFLQPELAFGGLRSSSNYEDDADDLRLGVGRNGLGAKITNIYSERFEVDINDVPNGQKYKGVWTNNMGKMVNSKATPGYDENKKSLVPTKERPKKSEYSKSYVKVSYKPDLTKFNYTKKVLDELPEFTIDIFRRIVFDIAFATRIPISFDDGEMKMMFAFKTLEHFIPVYIEEFRGAEKSTDFPIIYYHSYLKKDERPTGTGGGSKGTVNTYVTDPSKPIELYNKTTPNAVKLKTYKEIIDVGLEVFITKNYDKTNTNNNIFFVNGLKMENGKFIEEVIDKTFLIKFINNLPQKFVKASEKSGTKITAKSIKKYFTFIINLFVPNPEFGGQTKNTLTQPSIKIIDKSIDDKMKTIVKSKAWSDILSDIEKTLNINEDKLLTKSDGTGKKRTTGISSLTEANYAGQRKHVNNCVLWLAEGDSAAKYVHARIPLIKNGKDFNGIYGIRGKFINVRKAPASQLLKSKEYQNFKSIMNLKETDTFKSDDDISSKLKYGRVMIAADSDVDGIHIRMLLLNLIGTKWPDLVRMGRVAYINTPAIRIIDKKSEKTYKRFYSDDAYECWLNENDSHRKIVDSGKYTVKHYKGLATSEKKDVTEDLTTAPVVNILYDDKLDDTIELAFGKLMSDERKDWILDWKKSLEGVDGNGSMTGCEFVLEKISEDVKDTEKLVERSGSDIINKDLILYSSENLERALPSIFDGLKKVNRQILYYCLNHWNYGNTAKPDVKVSNLTGLIIDTMNYQHGPTSLEGAIMNMANTACGTNNINLLFPKGMFRTRQDDKNPAARYVSTRLSEYVPYIFKKEMVDIIKRKNVEGKEVEPEWIPCDIPLAVINGSEGIATGWSTYIPNYNVKEIVRWYIDVLSGKKNIKNFNKENFLPYYNGFKGDVVYHSTDNSFELKGIYSLNSDKKGDKYTVEITEIPPQYTIEKYSEHLNSLIEKKRLKDYIDRCDGQNNVIYFKLNDFVMDSKDKNIESNNNLMITYKHSLNNMHVINSENTPIKFDTINGMLKVHLEEMLVVYEVYKQNVLESILEDIKRMSDRLKIILAIVNDRLLVAKRPRKEIEENIAKQKLNLEEFDKIKANDMNQDEIDRLKKAISKRQDEYKSFEKIPFEYLYQERLEKFLKFIDGKF